MPKNETNKIVKESITDALWMLLKKKSLADISVSELTEKAGVGRVSFYRNFESKEQVILDDLKSQSAEWLATLRMPKEEDFILSMFEYFYSIKDKLLLLYRHGLSSLFMLHIKSWSGPTPQMNNTQAYATAVVSAIYFGWADEWIARGMQETPKEMLELFVAFKRDQK